MKLKGSKDNVHLFPSMLEWSRTINIFKLYIINNFIISRKYLLITGYLPLKKKLKKALTVKS